ncbi:YDR447Cp-like protein, partial [Hanseniaspora valbyensis NRRL Y-1626]
VSLQVARRRKRRKDQYVPEISELDLKRSNGVINVDRQTEDMIKSLGLKLPISVTNISANRKFRKRA